MPIQQPDYQQTMKKFTVLSLILIPAAFLSITGDAYAKSTPAKKTFAIAYKFSPGQTFNMKSEGATNVSTDQMGQTVTVDMTSASESAYRVLAGAPEGKMQLETEFLSRKQSTKSPMGDTDTDFSAWIGKKAQFTIAPDGTLSDFKGFDQLMEITAATGEKINGEMIQKGMAMQFFKLPDHPVKMGESWSAKDSINIPYQGSTLKNVDSTTATVVDQVKIDGLECLKISLEGTATLTGQFEQQGSQIELSRQTTVAGTIYFSLEKGMYVSIESTSNATGQIYVEAAGVTIPQTVTGKSSVKVVFN
jgi:hypothetical protein